MLCNDLSPKFLFNRIIKLSLDFFDELIPSIFIYFNTQGNISVLG